MARARRQNRPKSEWKALVQEQINSGLEVTDFCAQKDIPPDSLRRWKRYFKPKDATAESNHFIEIPNQPVSSVNPDPVQRIELDLGNGMTLRVYS